MADEALASFQLLLKDVPHWISDLETILTTAAQYQTTTESAQQPVARSARKSLTNSLRSKGEQRLPHLTSTTYLRLSQRKRKTASVCSRAGSNPSNYRSRSLRTIYYDGNAQKAFETVVRAIGTTRNSIRKAKLGMKIDSLARTGSADSTCSGSSGRETIKGLGTFGYRTTITILRPPPPPTASKEDTEAFDSIDTALDNAQMLCEHAAHQILRDGDCSVEIAKAKEHFHEAMNTVKAELPDLSRRAAKAASRRKAAEDEKYGLHEDDDARLPSRHDDHGLLSDGVLEVDSDEVVDDSESEDFDISTMKLPPTLNKYASTRFQLPSIVTAA